MYGNAMMRRLLWPLVTGVCLLAVSGCTHAHANVTPDQPPLDMPAPPPRNVEPLDAEVPAPMPLPDEPEHQTPSRLRPPQHEGAKPAEPPKAEPPKIETPEAAKPPEEAPRPATPPATTLQTVPPNAEVEMERTIRATLGKATNDLSHVDYRGLNPDARNQYDTAKNFIRQAEAAMTAKNLALAKILADKSAVLAVQLAGR
jgi:hypothetical protein